MKPEFNPAAQQEIREIAKRYFGEHVLVREADTSVPEDLVAEVIKHTLLEALEAAYLAGMVDRMKHG